MVFILTAYVKGHYTIQIGEPNIIHKFNINYFKERFIYSLIYN
jgi:hypothetical protein